MSPEEIIERIQNDLMVDAPDGFLTIVLGSQELQLALQAFKDEATEGLRGRTPDLAARLSLRKREILNNTPVQARAPIERLLTRAVDEVLRAARGNA